MADKPMRPIIPVCKYCWRWTATKAKRGVCHRYPPVLRVFTKKGEGEEDANGVWDHDFVQPITMESTSCGEFTLDPMNMY